MAAYDLRVQKPASLAIPDSPGANDLARFLSVSESSRANREKEELNQNMFDWEKGAGQRKRDRNKEFGNALGVNTENYMDEARKNFALKDSVLSRLRKEHPNATPDQIESLTNSAIETITQDPSYFINQSDMNRDVNLSLLKGGFSPERAEATKNHIDSYYGTPAAPNEELMKARLEAIQKGSLLDYMSPYNASGSGGSGGSGGSKGSSNFRDEEEFGQKQRNNPDNQFQQGSEDWWNWELPFTGDRIWTDELEEFGTLLQTEEGIKPQYVNTVIQGMAKDGKLPKGFSSEDMKNPKSDLYQGVKQNAATLQRQSEGNNSSGGKNNISLAQLNKLAQGSLEMKMQAFNEVGKMYQRAGGGTLTADEQYAIISDPALLKEFGVVIEESVKRPGKGNNASGNSKNAEAAKTNNTSSVAAEKGDDPKLKSLIEGENKDDQPIEEATEEEVLKAISNTPVSNSSGEYKSRDELVAIQELKNKVNSGNATQAEKDSLIDIYSDTDTDLEIEVTLPENVKDMTFMDLRESVPEGADRQKIYDLYRKGKAGNASKSEMKELSDALNSGSRKTK